MEQSEQCPFLLISGELIFVPTPLAVHISGYRDLFREVHADSVFCQTAFGDHFKPRTWTDEDIRDTVLPNDITRRWNVRGMGDFALGVLPSPVRVCPINSTMPSERGTIMGRPVKNADRDTWIIENHSCIDLLSEQFHYTRWVGYVCVRDAIPGLPAAETPFPPWQDMIEVRYGLHSSARGSGIVTRAQRSVMEWAAQELGVRRFIAETLTTNSGSAKVLERLGFVRTDTTYFGMDDAVEWCKEVA